MKSNPNNRSASRGFALADALAIVAVTGTAAVIAPSMVGSASVSASRSRCVANQRLLGQAQAMYMADNFDQYAGLNTSGAAYQGFGFTPTAGLVDFADALRGDTQRTTPTSSWDWISPILGDKGRFSANRAERLAESLDRLACPDATRLNDGVFLGDGDSPENADFAAAFAKGVTQVSYLQPASFQLYSAAADPDDVPESGPAGGDFLFRSTLRRAIGGLPAVSPTDFRPVLDRVGVSPSAKIMHADGTRFLDGAGVLTVDSSADPMFYGNAGTGGPILEISTAYGRSALGAPGNLDLTFRHGGDIFATMFDGAVRTISSEQAWTDPAPWYPSGSVFTGENATAESVGFVGANYAGGVLP